MRLNPGLCDRFLSLCWVVTVSYKKSSARDLETNGRIEGLNLLSNVLPGNCPDLYVYNAASQGIIYKRDDFADLTGMFESNKGCIWVITQLNGAKIVIPKAIHITHPLTPFSRAFSKQLHLWLV